MKIDDIMKLVRTDDGVANAIAELKQHRFIPEVDVDAAIKALDPSRHDIYDQILRPKKKVLVTSEDNSANTKNVMSSDGVSGQNFKYEDVARIALALQKLIIKRAVSFCFGNPVLYNSTTENENQQAIVKALQKILYNVKSNALNRKIGRSIFAFKECAEYWYTVEQPHSKYGFNSRYKLRCMLFSPEQGDTLYPFFDETGDMVAFSRSFARKDLKEQVTTFFETFTANEHWLWCLGASGYEVVEGYPKPIAIGKIPVVFGHQPYFETEEVDKLIDRLEKLLSNFADTNDYHASPKLFVTGNVVGWAKKGEAGAVIEGEEGATMQYVSWQNAPESVKLEIDTLLQMIYTITQTPDISFDAVKGLGAISGVALKLLFMDAHLKVQDKREIFDDYLQRRVNVILAYIAMMNTRLANDCEAIEIEPEIVPYMITSDIDDLNYWLSANGNKPLISQEESIEKAGITKNVEETVRKIQEEEERANTFNIAEPTDA